ncbi:MAG: hypothetical protein ABF743_11170 [Schleiferilactobacillus perolens]|uniref:hypothetical protein n=1 Tax=Schleiferilactobacillus perolens TaxID=100468 RepID=UPI0039E85559|nr:hypothetical protein [Schleiferilactobacillus harbinensis]MCI1913820.1 hypothetical protein [Schleiferilactobacillus harbinensis]
MRCSISGQFEQIADTDSANYSEPSEKKELEASVSWTKGISITEKTRYTSGDAHNRLDVTPGKGADEGENPKLDSQVRNDAKANYSVTDDKRKKAEKKP